MAKIWANEFIEFGSLLKRGISEASYHIAVRSGSVFQSNPTLSLEPTTKSRTISNVETWTTAFQIFVGIYTSKFPLEAPSLMKYGEVVRDLASRGGDWSFYEKQFRCLRQLYPNEMPWGSTHWELWIKAQNFGNSKPKIPQGKSSRFISLGIPKGFCHKFHKGLECNGCKYKHTCYKCNLSHPATRCNFRSGYQSSRHPCQVPSFQPQFKLSVFFPYCMDMMWMHCIMVLNLVFPFIFKDHVFPFMQKI